MDPQICQSCGMVMQKEEELGTNLDNTFNYEYCNYCFQNGDFTDAGITMEEKINRLVEFAKDRMNMTEAQAREMASNIIPSLKRWKKS
jgi:hypothetical protein